MQYRNTQTGEILTEQQFQQRYGSVDTGISARFKSSFGTPQEQEQMKQAEETKGLRGPFAGGLSEIPRDIAQVAGEALPLAGMSLGSIPGAAAGFIAGGPPGAIAGGIAGAAGGAGIGEFLRQRIGSILGVQKETTSLEQAKEIGSQAIIGGTAELGGQILSKIGSPILNALKTKIWNPIKRVAGETIKDLFKATTSVPEKVLERAAISTEAPLVKAGFNKDVTATTVRDEAIKAYNSVSKELSDTWKNMTDPVFQEQITKGTLKEVQNNFQTNIVDLFKQKMTDFGAKFSGDEIKTMPIRIRGEAEKNVRFAWQRIQAIKQSDLSPTGLEELAKDILSLSKFTDADLKSKATPIVSTLQHEISKLIESSYPQLGEARKLYSQTSKILDEADVLLKARTNDIKTVRASVAKLTNLFKEDNDIYINALKTLEDKSGMPFLSKLAGTEFQRITPGILRTSLALGGAGGAVATGIVSPWALLLLPIFSPRAVGGLITNTAMSKAYMEAIMKAVLKTETLDTATKIFINRYINGKLEE